MASYIQTLLSQLNDVDVNDASTTKALEPVGKDDRVLGVCPDDLKRLKVHIHHIMVRQNALRKKIRILKIEHEGEENPPMGFDQLQFDRLQAEADRLRDEYKILDGLFWFDLQQHFAGKVGSDAVTIGVRQDWQVVSTNASGVLKTKCITILKIIEDTK